MAAVFIEECGQGVGIEVPAHIGRAAKAKNIDPRIAMPIDMGM